ncbi:MAG TPA: LysR substrate-binding domain-containing protein [Burkholderiaceae bacterium]|nr:LysR substrate-binding domain-containing protein [Burkholderiaceae bacterium]
MSLDLLRGFRIAARHLSFTRAARELFITQPAISREIKTLEEQLGQPLFRRVNRSLQLTAAGAELYRAAEEALALIDATEERLTGGSRALGITTTTALASSWLVPRLPEFTRRHPEIETRIAASNDTIDLVREQLDVAIRYVPRGSDVPGGELLVDYATFPVCAPELLRDRARPLRNPTDLARHTLLDFEAVLYGRAWSDWAQWFSAMKVRGVKPVSTLRFSHYDQVIQAALSGVGIAIGKVPHLTRHLRKGVLHAPLGRDWAARLGSFHIVLAPGAAERGPVTAFVAWLREQVRLDALPSPRRGASAQSRLRRPR